LRKINHGKFSKSGKRGRSPVERTVQWVPLAGVLVGATMLAVGVVSLYLAMRTVGLENGGSCVSGGPYEIAPGHECRDGVFALGYGGAVGFFVGFLIFAYSSRRYGGPLVVTSASGIGVISLFGGLGAGFLSIASEMPRSSDLGSEFKTVGIIFIVFASAGLAVAIGAIPYSILSGQLDYPKPTPAAWAAWFATVALGVGVGFAALELSSVFF
jgi:hypothetical protein